MGYEKISGDPIGVPAGITYTHLGVMPEVNTHLLKLNIHGKQYTFSSATALALASEVQAQLRLRTRSTEHRAKQRPRAEPGFASLQNELSVLDNLKGPFWPYKCREVRKSSRKIGLKAK